MIADLHAEKSTLSPRQVKRQLRRVRQQTGGQILPLWAALLAAVVGGPILDLAYPSVGIWPLAFVGIALALIGLVGRGSWSALLVGLVFGASFYFTHISWITRYLGLIPWFGLAGLEMLLWGAGSILITLGYRWLPRLLPKVWARLTVLPLLIAAIWTAREMFLGSWPYTGFPWGRMGMSQSESPLAHVASWVGVTGLTFLMVAFTAAVIEFVRVRRFTDVRAYVPAAVLGVILLVTPQWATTPAGSLRVGSVQGNGPAGYFDEREPHGVLQSQLDATAPLLNGGLDVLLWPEGGIDSDPTHYAPTADVLDRLADVLDAPLIVAAATTRGNRVFNTSMLWEPGAQNPVAVHDKRVPVPMGEYVPDRWFFEMLVPDLISLIQREYTPGTNPSVFDLGETQVGLAICFDVLYDSVIWEGAQGGAEVFMLQTNNADFRETDENLQQLAFARMRAIETGRSVVNISTVGTSQVMGPDGTTIDELPAAEPGAMLTDVELRTGLTPAVVLGPWINALALWGGFGALAAVGLIDLVRRRTARA